VSRRIELLSAEGEHIDWLREKRAVALLTSGKATKISEHRIRYLALRPRTQAPTTRDALRPARSELVTRGSTALLAIVGGVEIREILDRWREQPLAAPVVQEFCGRDAFPDRPVLVERHQGRRAARRKR
jgi:hypothetical protein